MFFNLQCCIVLARKRKQILLLIGNNIHHNFHLLREDAWLAMIINLFYILDAIILAHLIKHDALQVFTAIFWDFGIILEVRT